MDQGQGAEAYHSCIWVKAGYNPWMSRQLIKGYVSTLGFSSMLKGSPPANNTFQILSAPGLEPRTLYFSV